MNRIALLSSVAFVASILSAKDYTDYGITYRLNDTDYTAKVIAADQTSAGFSVNLRRLSVYDEEEGYSKYYTITEVNSLVFMDFKKLKSVYAPDVKKIGSLAFAGCNALETVSIPSAVSIGERAFLSCNIREISLPSAKTIEDGAFTGCKLKSISIPAVETIGENAFNSGLFESLTLPASLTSVGSDAFCISTDSLTIVFEGSAPAPELGLRAFSTWEGVLSVYLPNVKSRADADSWLKVLGQCDPIGTISFAVAPPDPPSKDELASAQPVVFMKAGESTLALDEYNARCVANGLPVKDEPIAVTKAALSSANIEAVEIKDGKVTVDVAVEKTESLDDPKWEKVEGTSFVIDLSGLSGFIRLMSKDAAK